jgi:hypothetical protein
MKFAYPPIFQIYFCRNWHLEPTLRCIRLPRFQRAGPSTSLDRSALGRVYGEMLSYSNMIVNFLKLDYSGSNTGFKYLVLSFYLFFLFTRALPWISIFHVTTQADETKGGK